MNENTIFFLIYLFIVLVFVLFCAVILSSIFKSFKKLFRGIFNIEERVGRREEGSTLKESEITKEFKITKEEDKKELVIAPKKQFSGNLGGYVNTSHKDEAEIEKDIATEQREKKEKDIAKGLDFLKKSSSKEEPSKLSGLPSREEKDENSDIYEAIKIPKRRRFFGKKSDGKVSVSAPSNKVFGNMGGYVDTSRKKEAERHSGEKTISKGALFGGSQSTESKKIAESLAGNTSKVSNAQKDSSIFGGKSEISRIKLKHELRFNTKVWQAERQSGLTLSPIERSKLEKEVFSQVLGRNISKSDIKWGVRKLNQKMLSTKDLAEKGKLRKEVKFFKKIGGIR